MTYSCHPTALVAPDARIGNGTRIWAFVNVQSGVVIGLDCNICDNCFIEKGVTLGDRVTVKNGVAVYEGVTLEDDVFVGPNAVFVNDRHPRSRSTGWTLEKSLIKKGASLGANCTVMCGVTVGDYAVVGAAAVILHDVPAHAIVVGNPARQTGWADIDGSKLGDDLAGGGGRKYRITAGGLVLAGGEGG